MSDKRPAEGASPGPQEPYTAYERQLRAENERLRHELWKYDEGVRAVTNGLTTAQQFVIEAASARLCDTPDGDSP